MKVERSVTQLNSRSELTFVKTTLFFDDGFQEVRNVLCHSCLFFFSVWETGHLSSFDDPWTVRQFDTSEHCWCMTDQGNWLLWFKEGSDGLLVTVENEGEKRDTEMRMKRRTLSVLHNLRYWILSRPRKSIRKTAFVFFRDREGQCRIARRGKDTHSGSSFSKTGPCPPG